MTSAARRAHLRRIGQQPGERGRNPWGKRGKLGRADVFRDVGDEVIDPATGRTRIETLVRREYELAETGDRFARAACYDGYFGKLQPFGIPDDSEDSAGIVIIEVPQEAIDSLPSVPGNGITH